MWHYVPVYQTNGITPENTVLLKVTAVISLSYAISQLDKKQQIPNYTYIKK